MSSETRPNPTTKVVVATTVALTFISFWRAAAVVLSDLASSAFYAGGIAEHAIGKSAPWFILAVMLFSFAVRSVYLESCSMFVRGGVYIVVRDAMGHFMARLSVSALMFDYILTGPISVVSAGLYLGKLLNEFAEMGHVGTRVPPNLFAAGFGMLVTAYFWRSNIRGIHESSGKALRIMQITTVMVVAFLIWCPITLLLQGHVALPPLPVPANIQFNEDALGWFNGTIWPQIGAIAIIIGFGHSLLSMSGFETLAQVYREIAYPKMKNLVYTGNLVCIYAVFCTGVITMFAVMIIPDSVRGQYVDNLLGGLAMNLAGPAMLRLIFRIFVVFVGVLILSGAVNTSIIGGNGVMNRLAEDGVLVDWFRKPHKVFGTSARMINVIAGLQIFTIFLSRGDVNLLGEAYAFGVVWSFFMKSLSVLVLRYKRHDQEYKVPGNFRIGTFEVPVGLATTTLILFLVAIANLFSKRIATIYGVGFTIFVFIIFTISEQVNKRRSHLVKSGLEEFNLDMQPEVTAETVHARPGCVLVAVRDYRHMAHLHAVLEKTNLRRHDIVVMTVRPVSTRRRGIRALRQTAIFRLREGTALGGCHHGGKGGQDRRPDRGSRRRSIRRHGADSGQAQGFAAGHRRFGDDGFRRTGATHRDGLGETARTAPSLLARNHHPRPPLGLREPWAASAAPLARRPGPRARSLAPAPGALRFEAASSRRGWVGLTPLAERPGRRAEARSIGRSGQGPA